MDGVFFDTLKGILVGLFLKGSFVHLKGEGITDQSVAGAISQSPDLAYIVLEDCPGITSQTFYEIYKRCPNLTELTCRQVSDFRVREIMWVTQGCKNLRKIYLNSGILSKSDISFIQRQLPGLEIIEEKSHC